MTPKTEVKLAFLDDAVASWEKFRMAWDDLMGNVERAKAAFQRDKFQPIPQNITESMNESGRLVDEARENMNDSMKMIRSFCADVS